tara:strand:- start:51 stop:509 length:459 start_codon:yes stop_codon:yes gene_type:complete
MKFIKTMLLLSFLSIMFLTMACEDNETVDTPPESATLSGTITFTGTWPDTGTVAVSLSSTWPPQGAPAASAAITSADLANNTYTYTFENVTFGSYASIAVSWEDPNDTNPMTNQYTLGAYGGTDPTAVTVSETEYELTDLSFDADLSLATSN